MWCFRKTVKPDSMCLMNLLNHVLVRVAFVPELLKMSISVNLFHFQCQMLSSSISDRNLTPIFDFHDMFFYTSMTCFKSTAKFNVCAFKIRKNNSKSKNFPSIVKLGQILTRIIDWMCVTSRLLINKNLILSFFIFIWYWV